MSGELKINKIEDLRKHVEICLQNNAPPGFACLTREGSEPSYRNAIVVAVLKKMKAGIYHAAWAKELLKLYGDYE